MQLVIYDRIKSSLPSFLARHVLALEASCIDKGGWLGRQELIEALDAYVAGMNNPPKPAGNVQKGAVTCANKSFVGRNVPKKVGKVATENNGQGINSMPKSVTPRRCFGCGATGHLLNNCPDRRTTFSVGKKSTALSHQISHCAVDTSHGSFAPPYSDAGVEPGLCAIARHEASSPGGKLQDTALSPGCALVENEVTLTASTATDNNNKVNITSDDVVVKTETDKSCEIKNSEIHAERPIDSFLSDGWSDLRYVDVNIDGICGTFCGLDDSGAQLCLVRADVVAPLRLAKTGSVVLQDFLGNSYDADVFCLQMKLANAKTFVPVVCAVCDKLSNEFLLGADIIDKLNGV